LARDISTVCTIKKSNSSVNAYVIADRCIVLQCVTCVAMCCSALQHVVLFYGCTKQDSTMRILMYSTYTSPSLALFPSFSLCLSFLDGTTRFIFVEIRGSVSRRKTLPYSTRAIMLSRFSPSHSLSLMHTDQNGRGAAACREWVPETAYLGKRCRR